MSGRRALCERVVGREREVSAVLHKLSRKTNDVSVDPRERARHHAQEAERLLKSGWLSSHVRGPLHATLARYSSAKHGDE